MNTHPVFSDFSHIAGEQGLGNLTFAVGLRTENPEDAVARMLPLSVITPGVAVERVIRKVATDEVCERTDCLARKDLLNEIDGQNDDLKKEILKATGSIQAAKNKIQLTEKSIAMTEEKNDALKAEIDEVGQVMTSMESEVEKCTEYNEGLRQTVEALRKEIDAMREKLEEDSSLVQIMEKGNNEVVFSRRGAPKTAEEMFLSNEVSNLEGEEDSDDDE
jgi:chromosome segregation ATPase